VRPRCVPVGLPQSVKLLTATKVGQPLELIVIEASTFWGDITPNAHRSHGRNQSGAAWPPPCLRSARHLGRDRLPGKAAGRGAVGAATSGPREGGNLGIWNPENLPPINTGQNCVFLICCDAREAQHERAKEHHVKVKRIVSNVVASDVEKASAFYEEVLGLKVLMDLGWIRTYGSGSKMTIQISVMSEGGSGTAVPDISIEVDDIEEALARVQRASIPIEYGPTTEPWGVRRFYVRDPFGKLINILQHE